MFRKDQFGVVFNTIFAIMFAICLPIFIDWRNGMLGIERFCQNFIPAFAVTFAIGTYIDLKAMGDGFARFCRVKNENGLLFHILRVASITFVMTFLMSLIMMFLDIGFAMGPFFFVAFLTSFPLTFVFALVVAFVTFAIGMPLTMALCSKPPKGAPAGAHI